MQLSMFPRNFMVVLDIRIQESVTQLENYNFDIAR